jgi:hypothetical protein
MFQSANDRVFNSEKLGEVMSKNGKGKTLFQSANDRVFNSEMRPVAHLIS